ncbi:MAG TPA: SBBP repeat-containing protein, partial [Leptospiraceae bacterium]|nr:SBBP repeat-containing protein [Leptospiraceae bacterium]
NCLKADKSPFDISSKSPVSSGFAVLSLLGASSSSKNQASETAAPSNISYGSQSSFNLIPGVAISYKPTVTGTVDSWSISPALPTGLTFNSQTGEISGTPDALSYLASGFPLTTFTVAAINSGGTQNFLISLKILASGENVWTVISGTAGQNIGVNQGSLTVDNTSDTTSLLISGLISGNFDGETDPSSGAGAVFVSKYDLSGSRTWTKMLGVAGFQTISAGIRIDSSSSIFVGGSTFGNLDGNTIVGSKNMFISKFNSSGTKLWTKTRGAASYAEGTSIFLDSSGNPYGTGYLSAPSLDGFTNTGWGSNGLQAVKFDTNGNWLTTSGVASNTGAQNVEGYASTVLSTGTIVIGGMSMSSGRCASGNGVHTPVIFLFNTSLTYTGCGAVTAGSDTFIFGLEKDSSDSIYAVGYTDSNTFDGITKTSSAGTGKYDGFLVKFNSSGTRLWTRLIGVTGNTVTRGFAVTVSSDNSIYLTGLTNGNLFSETLNGTQDMFIIKYDQSGTRIWTRLIGAAGTVTQGNGITFDSNNTMYAAGTTTGDLFGTVNPVKPNSAMFITRFVR